MQVEVVRQCKLLHKQTVAVTNPDSAVGLASSLDSFISTRAQKHCISVVNLQHELNRPCEKVLS